MAPLDMFFGDAPYDSSPNLSVQRFKENRNQKMLITPNMPTAGKSTRSLRQQQPVLMGSGILKDLKTNSIKIDIIKEPAAILGNLRPFKPYVPHYRQFPKEKTEKNIIKNTCFVSKHANRIDRFVPKPSNEYKYHKIRERSSWAPGKLGLVPGLTRYNLRTRANPDKNGSFSSTGQYQKPSLRNYKFQSPTSNEPKNYINGVVRTLKTNPIRDYKYNANNPTFEVRSNIDKTNFDRYNQFPKNYNNRYGK